MDTPSISVWRTIHLSRIGWGFKQLLEYNFRESKQIRLYGPTANFNPRGPIPSTGECELVLVAPEDIGFTALCSYYALIERARALGLKTVHPGIGLQLYCAGIDEPMDEAVIASDPKEIPDTGEGLCGICVGRDDEGMRLSTNFCSVIPTEPSIEPDQHFVFQKAA